MKPRCNCPLAHGPAETVAPELHDEDCALYLEALAAEEVRERFKTLARAFADEVAAGIRCGEWVTEPEKQT